MKTGMNTCEGIWWEREAEEAIGRIVEVWRSAPAHAHRARADLRRRLLAALNAVESGIDVQAVMEWERRVEDAGVFASMDDLLALIASAPTGADTSVIRGVLDGRLIAGGAA